MLINKKKLVQAVLPVLAAVALQSYVSADTTGDTSHRSSTPTKSTVRPASLTGTHKSPITISFTSRMREGNLVVSLDNVPVFNEPFHKPPFLISQTTKWDPLQVTAGKHRLTAKVYDAKGKTYLSGVYDLEVSKTKGIELRIRVKGDSLTVEPAS